MDDNMIVKKACNSTLVLRDLGQTNWCTHVKTVLNEARMQQVWNEKYTDNNKFALLTEYLCRAFMDQCMLNINNSIQSSKLRTFKLFKTEFKFENYLQIQEIWDMCVHFSDLGLVLTT